MSTITTFFGSTNLNKHGDETHQWFLEDLVLYICKGYKPLSTCKNIWLRSLVIHQCLCVNFLSCSNLLEHVLPEIIQKTMNLHVLPSLKTITIFLQALIFGCLEVG
jgi:hypothetical protein